MLRSIRGYVLAAGLLPGYIARCDAGIWEDASSPLVDRGLTLSELWWYQLRHSSLLCAQRNEAIWTSVTLRVMSYHRIGYEIHVQNVKNTVSTDNNNNIIIITIWFIKRHMVVTSEARCYQKAPTLSFKAPVRAHVLEHIEWLVEYIHSTVGL